MVGWPALVAVAAGLLALSLAISLLVGLLPRRLRLAAALRMGER